MDHHARSPARVHRRARDLSSALHPPGRRDRRAPDCVRERREPRAGPWIGPGARAGGARLAWREPSAADSAVGRRRSGPRIGRRGARRRIGGHHHAGPGSHGPASDAVSRRHPVERACTPRDRARMRPGRNRVRRHSGDVGLDVAGEWRAARRLVGHGDVGPDRSTPQPAGRRRDRGDGRPGYGRRRC